MHKIASFLAGVVLLNFTVFPAKAAFTSLYVFGDGISTTTNNPSTGPLYYGKRYSNGRVWVEVLAQRQGLTYDFNKNWSYFYNTSTSMLAHVNNFNPPPDAGTALFVVWVNNADLWFPAYYSGANMTAWNNAIKQSQTNHYKAAINLYAKGVRTLVMPNAVDLSTIPEFNTSVNANFIHLRCLDYNVAFTNTLNQIRAACPGLTIYSPDFFTLLTNLLANPAEYGVTNALGDGLPIDAIDAVNYGCPSATINGYGTNYIFWDIDNPTAMVHTWMANLAQQLISPVQISKLTLLNGSNRLDLVNVPVGQNGLVLGCTNQLSWESWKSSDWTTTASFSSTNITQSVFVPSSDAVSPQARQLSPMAGIGDPGDGGTGTNSQFLNPKLQLYQLSYPYTWTWP